MKKKKNKKIILPFKFLTDNTVILLESMSGSRSGSKKLWRFQ